MVSRDDLDLDCYTEDNIQHCTLRVKNRDIDFDVSSGEGYEE